MLMTNAFFAEWRIVFTVLTVDQVLVCFIFALRSEQTCTIFCNVLFIDFLQMSGLPIFA